MIQVTPKAITTRQCQGPQGSRSIRAGMSVVRRFEAAVDAMLMRSREFRSALTSAGMSTIYGLVPCKSQARSSGVWSCR